MHSIKSLILATPFFIISCTEQTASDHQEIAALTVEQVQKAKAHVQNVNPQQFHQLIAKADGIILDVRTPEETAKGAIENASFINVNDRAFVRRIKLMQKDKPIYVYCASGGRSANAADLLIQNGFKDVYNLSGGIRSWTASGFEITPPKEGSISNVTQLTFPEFMKMLDTEKPVLIDFHTQWCSPCKKMSPIIDALTTENKGKAEILKIDVDQSIEVAQKLNIKGVPVFILYENGKETWRQSGILTQAELQAVLDGAMGLM
jgi:thioredoxin 1